MVQVFLLGTSLGFALYIVFSLIGYALRSSFELFKIS